MDKPFALIIDDDRNVAAMFRHVLDLAGFRSEVILDGRAAMERLDRARPDLILLDLNLAGVPGDQILDRIKKDERLSHTKVIMITGEPHLAGRLSTQPDLLLLKPVSADQLTGLVTRLVLSEKSPKAAPMTIKVVDRTSGLYNQPFFVNRLGSSLRQANEVDSYLFTVLLFKLERSRESRGRAVRHDWETTLREVAALTRKILRPTDTIARFDPDTFYILLENVPSGEIAVKAANRIQEVLYRNIPDVERKIKIPIRIGILLCDSGYENVETILGDARNALALADAQGDEYAQFYYQVTAKKKSA